jgi:hypothetical protein
MTALLMLVLAVDLSSIRNEPNPERRSDLAMENANSALDQAKDAARAGNDAKLQTALDEIGDSVDLAYESLAGEPHRNQRAFKKAEQRTHLLERRLDSFRDLVDSDDRVKVDKIRERVAVAHDNLLNGIMKKK